MKLAESIVDSGRPEPLLRAGIRAVCALRLREQRGTIEDEQARHQAFVDQLRGSDIAIETAAANAQHYEVPARFFTRVLGPHFKYSSRYRPMSARTLGDAEAAMLELTAARAQLAPPGKPCSISAAAGARCRCGRRRSFRRVGSPRCRTRARSARSSRRAPRSAG